MLNNKAVGDCWIDGNAEAHECLVGKVFPSRATVMSLKIS
jgi:hypothetical protein